MIPAEKLEQIITRAESLEARLAEPGKLGSEEFASISKEYSELSPIVEKIQALQSARQEAADLDAMIGDAETDPEMRELAEAELSDVRERVAGLEYAVRLLLLPKDIADEKNAILEIRAGTGGEEAALFAADLFRMYQRYADQRGWRFEAMEINESAVGGYKEAVVKIGGKGAFARLKFESGVHRVQRVPETEAGGRIHTSAATVAVLPEAEDVDVHIADKDLRIDVFRASGPGGQSVNTTDSAVRVTHIPTGIVVQQQDEKSQHKNRAKALTILRSRLLQEERERQIAERAESRKIQVGSGDRSERVRTYNFPQNRVTDHRINLTLHKLEQIMSGEALDLVIDELIAADQAEQIAALEAV